MPDHCALPWQELFDDEIETKTTAKNLAGNQENSNLWNSFANEKTREEEEEMDALLLEAEDESAMDALLLGTIHILRQQERGEGGRPNAYFCCKTKDKFGSFLKKLFHFSISHTYHHNSSWTIRQAGNSL